MKERPAVFINLLESYYLSGSPVKSCGFLKKSYLYPQKALHGAV